MTGTFIFDWNVGGMTECDGRMTYLQKKTRGKEFVAVLENVRTSAVDGIRKMFGRRADVICSSDLCTPEGPEEDLCMVAIVSGGLGIVSAGTLEDVPMPQHTLLLEVGSNDHELIVMGLHTTTDRRYRSAQIGSFARAVIDIGPDVVCFDIDEPKVDHYEIGGMTFSEDDGAARAFFESLETSGLSNTCSRGYTKSRYVAGEPLETTYMDGDVAHRFDFIYFRGNRLQLPSHECDYDGAVKAGSDHALISLNALVFPKGSKEVDVKPGEGDSPFTQDELDDIWKEAEENRMSPED